MDNAFPRIELQGEYDLASKEALAALFESLRADRPVEIDMTKVTYMDSTVLQELAKLRDRFEDQSIKLLVRGSSILRLLHMVQFDKLFEIVEA